MSSNREAIRTHHDLLSPTFVLSRFGKSVGWETGDDDGRNHYYAPAGQRIHVSNVYSRYAEFSYLFSDSADEIVQRFLLHEGLPEWHSPNRTPAVGIHAEKAAQLLRDERFREAIRRGLEDVPNVERRLGELGQEQIISTMMTRALTDVYGNGQAGLIEAIFTYEDNEYRLSPANSNRWHGCGQDTLLSVSYVPPGFQRRGTASVQLAYGWSLVGRESERHTVALAFSNDRGGNPRALAVWLYALIALSTSYDVAERALTDFSLSLL